MRTILILLALGVLGMAAISIFVRLAPTDPQSWHVDPVAADDPGPGGVRLAGGTAPVWQTSPSELAAALDRAMLSRPRTRRIAGDPASGHATYVFRSLIFGFPDYLTARAVEIPGGARLDVLSRSRFGGSDLGANAAMVDALIEDLDGTLERLSP